MGPCIVNVFKHNQQAATLHNSIYYYKCSTCFRLFLRPSSGAQNFIQSIGYLSSFYCFLPFAHAASCWLYLKTLMNFAYVLVSQPSPFPQKYFQKLGQFPFLGEKVSLSTMRRVAAVGHKAVHSSATLHLRRAIDAFRETLSHFLNTEGRTEFKNLAILNGET